MKYIPSYYAGWSNAWVDGMYTYIGDDKEYTVKGVCSQGVYFDEDDARYGFPPHALELVENPALVMHKAKSLLHRVIHEALRDPVRNNESIIAAAIAAEQEALILGPAPTK